ncbi:MAG TPA: sensor domain-containing diguanylate cyclase [Ilumatobacteraceae bacterium]|jgi:diguanylate cyclase (GGDEF)-like protein/PAS domain S-box-containing protein
MTASSPRINLRIMDAVDGPLIGDGRLRRVTPFLITAIVSMVVAIPAMSLTRPLLAVAGTALALAAMVASVIFPWNRVPRSAQLAPPLLFLVATMLLASATGIGMGSPFVTMSVLPIMWLAIYENRVGVLMAAALAGGGLWLAAGGERVPSSAQGTVCIIVYVVCGAGMGVTLHGLVSDARRLAIASRDHQMALENVAEMLDALPERVNRYRLPDLAIMYCNAAWATQYDVEPGAALGRPLDEFLSQDELDGLHSQLALLGPENPILVDSAARSVDNGQWLEWADRYIEGADGPEVLSVGRDVTGRRDAELKLAESEARFRDLADKSADVVWRFLAEPTPHFDYISPSVENILGYTPAYFVEDFSRIVEVLDDEGRSAIQRALEGKQDLGQFDFHLRHANGSIVIAETRTTSVHGGLQGVSRDVTELRELQESMAALALRDSLTGLANRRLFKELLDADLARTQRSGLPLALAFLDLDGFKKVNDTYGHDAGDIVLCEIARRLLAIVRGADTVARIGGDEFVIVYEPNDPNSKNLVPRIDRALSASIDITPSIAVHCPASIGVADTRVVGCNGAALLAAADEAMYAVKRSRQNARHATEERERIGALSP